jgi:hypothetical protein
MEDDFDDDFNSQSNLKDYSNQHSEENKVSQYFSLRWTSI